MHEPADFNVNCHVNNSGSTLKDWPTTGGVDDLRSLTPKVTILLCFYIDALSLLLLHYAVGQSTCDAPLKPEAGSSSSSRYYSNSRGIPAGDQPAWKVDLAGDQPARS